MGTGDDSTQHPDAKSTENVKLMVVAGAREQARIFFDGTKSLQDY